MHNSGYQKNDVGYKVKRRQRVACRKVGDCDVFCRLDVTVRNWDDSRLTSVPSSKPSRNALGKVWLKHLHNFAVNPKSEEK